MTSKSSSSLKILWLYLFSKLQRGLLSELLFWLCKAQGSLSCKCNKSRREARKINYFRWTQVSLSFIFQTHIIPSNAKVLTMCMWFKDWKISFRSNPSLTMPPCLRFLFLTPFLQGKIHDASVETIIIWQGHVTWQPWTPPANLNITCNLHNHIILFSYATTIHWKLYYLSLS